jgi:glycosyltransferase involved in cell wall biosynthesis
MNSENAEVAVLIPCFNEAATIKKVVADFRKAVPTAQVVVVDNNSGDGTGDLAAQAGARVITCRRQGKGAALRKGLKEIQAQYYIVVDGDDTYPAEAAPEMLEAAKNGWDLVVGDRRSNGNYQKENKRKLHGVGNTIVCGSINMLFGTKVKDVLSGYRVMTREFAQNWPILLDGFEVETEMSIHAIEKLFEVKEIPVEYRDRPPGSKSKLNTVKDGMNVLRAILWIFKDTKPLILFGTVGGILALGSGVALGTGNSALASTLAIITTNVACCGLVLDTLAKYQRENFTNQLKKK